MDSFEVYLGNGGVWSRVALDGSNNPVNAIIKTGIDAIYPSITDSSTVSPRLSKFGGDVVFTSISELAQVSSSGTSIKQSSDLVSMSFSDIAGITSQVGDSEFLIPTVEGTTYVFRSDPNNTSSGLYGSGLYGAGVYGSGGATRPRWLQVNHSNIGTQNFQFSWSVGWETSLLDHYSSQTSANSTLKFIGTSFSIVGSKASHHGDMKIVIDGGTPIIVDTYAAIRQRDVTLFSSSELPDVQHTVVISPNGTKNSASTGTTVAIEHALIAAPPGSEVPANVTPVGDKLPYSPPNVTWTKVYVRSSTTSALSLSDNVDYEVVFEVAVTNKLRITGGRNLLIRGAEFFINTDRSNGDASNLDNYNVNCALEIDGTPGVTRTVFIEGLKVHGAWALDGIRVRARTNNTALDTSTTTNDETTFILQNCYLECKRIVQGTGDVFHADGFQCWSGLAALYQYNVTVYNPYQTAMIGDGNLQGRWGRTELDRVNWRADTEVGQHHKPWNFVGGPHGGVRLVGPFIAKKGTVWLQPGPGRGWNTSSTGTLYSSTPPGVDEIGPYASPSLSVYSSAAPNATFSDGEGGPFKVYQGIPPGGDYCKPDTVGLGYVTPGYQDELTFTPVVNYQVVDLTGTRAATGHPSNGAGIQSVRLMIADDAAMTQNIRYTSPVTVNSVGTAHHTLPVLTRRSTPYYYRVLVKNSSGVEGMDAHPTIGQFTMGNSDTVSMGFSSCLNNTDSDAAADMAALKLEIGGFMGDLYYDDPATDISLSSMVSHIRAKLVAPKMRNWLATTRWWYQASDHEGLNDDSTAGNEPTAWVNFNDAMRLLLPFPFPPADPVTGKKGHYYYTDERNLRLVVLDDRSFKTNPLNPSDPNSTSKTALGTTQLNWLYNLIDTMPSHMTMAIAFGTPWVCAPDAGDDAWEGYIYERNLIANKIKASGKKIVGLGGDMHALAYHDGVNPSPSPGGIPVYQASPMSQGSSHKGGPWTNTPYPSTIGTQVQQYGRLDVASASTRFRGYSAGSSTVRKEHTKTW